MAEDMQRLVVSLEARIDSFEKALNRATGVANTQTKKIEDRFKSANSKMVAGMSSIGRTALSASSASEKLIAGMSQSAQATEAMGHAAGLASGQQQALFHSMRAMAEGVAMGVPPSQVLTQQLNHLTYAASGPGGLMGALRGVGSFIGSLFTPFRVVAGGIAGLGIAFANAAFSWQSSQTSIKQSLTGVGQAAGITVGTINKIAENVSSAGELSRKEATQIATTIASTGRASADATEKATGLAHAYSLVFDKDLAETGKDLAAALANPAKSIDTLNERLGAWDANQVALVKSLTASGDRAGAQQIIIDGLQKSIAEASAQTDIWTRAWNSLSNAFSNASTASGKAIVGSMGGSTPEDQLAAAQQRLNQLQNGRTRAGMPLGTPAEIAAQTAKVNELQASVERLHKAASDSRDAVEASDIIKGLDPTIQKLTDLQATIDKIKSQPVTDAASSEVRDRVVQSLETQKTAMQDNIALAKERYGITSAQLGLDAKASELELAAINARSPAQKAEIAYRQTLLQLTNTPGVSKQEAEIEAQIARVKTLNQAQHDLSEAQKDRIYQANQSVEAAQVENSTIGMSVQAATELTQRFQLLSAARAEAAKNGTVVSPSEIDAMNKAAAAMSRLAAANAALRTQEAARFDISQLGRSQSEQNVYSTLQGAGLLDNGQIVSEQAKQTAEILRTKEAMTQLADAEKDFASTFLHDLTQGKSAAEALADALSNVADKLLNSGIDSLLSGGGGGLLGSIFGGGGASTTSGWATSVLPAFAKGGVSKGPAIFGEAGAEAAVPLPDGRRIPVDLRMPSVQTAITPSGGQSLALTVAIDARGATQDSVAQMKNDLVPTIQKVVRNEVNQLFDRSARFAKTGI